jgi:Flp pilus assembly protein TadD
LYSPPLPPTSRFSNYGLAEVYFRKAVESNPNNGDAWIGLAASYDRLRRFDVAERAYRVVVQKVGYTITVHNNLGYHYYLRGKLDKAREHFDAAHAMDTENPWVLNNLKLIEPS